MKSGVYKIVNKKSDKIYIGSSKYLETRRKQHFRLLRNKTHNNSYLQRAYDKDGLESFSFEIVLFCDEKNLLMYEQICLDHYKSYKKHIGYNLRIKAESNAGLDSGRTIPHYSGEKYNNLTLICLHEKTGAGNRWLCKCDCGNTTIRPIFSVVNNRAKSCGCLNAAARMKRVTHGMTGTREHRIWNRMRSKCFCQTDPNYSTHGGAGIGICEEWKDFVIFYMDMGKCPDGHTISRINRNLGYSKENCKWITIYGARGAAHKKCL